MVLPWDRWHYAWSMDQPQPATSSPSAAQGLTTAQAETILAQNGPNAIASVTANPLRRAVGKLWAPVPWMLEAAIILQLVLGDWLQAGVVAALLLVNATLGFLQEGRAEATLAALRSRLALSASVRRDGAWAILPVAELVPGDLVKLSLGSVVGADVTLTSGAVLVDQSMLTGESLPTEALPGTPAYAGALVRRGEAEALVTATGEHTKFGRSAELIRTAKSASAEQGAILRVVGSLALFNGVTTAVIAIYAYELALPASEIISLMLVAVLASIPVALPMMFTLAAAVGAQALGKLGVLPTRLSAVDEAAGIDLLCLDKTGTLTSNSLSVAAVQAVAGGDVANLLMLAALASTDGGQDPIDIAIRAKSAAQPTQNPATCLSFTAFDPALKRAEASVKLADGSTIRVVKGALGAIAALAQPCPEATPMTQAMQKSGLRVLAVAAGPPDALRILGIIGLSDPPRPDSAGLLAELRALGVRSVMITGDSAITAEAVGHAIGLTGEVCATIPVPSNVDIAKVSIFARVLPEDKFKLVQAFQADGHIVGMCGDGANDAPALRQAQMGIAVSTATDVAKSAAGIVLTEPGLSGIVATIREGRKTYQRILTYTLRSIVHKVMQVLFLAIGLLMTGQAILTPLLMVLMMVVGDFLAMSSSTDNVRPSTTPSVWKIRKLALAAVILGLMDLIFCASCLAVGKYVLHLDILSLRTMTVAILVLSGQAVLYVARERDHMWCSRPGRWLVLCSVIDLGILSVLALNGILMTALPPAILASLFGAAFVFTFLLDEVKVLLVRWLKFA